MFENNTYEEDVELFKEILSTDADNLLKTQELVAVYIGRGSCPYCRKFAKKLGSLVNQINTTIYYVNTDNFSDAGIESFRETYSVRTVPGFIVKKNNEIEVRCDSSTPEDEILAMLK